MFCFLFRNLHNIKIVYMHIYFCFMNTINGVQLESKFYHSDGMQCVRKTIKIY